MTAAPASPSLDYESLEKLNRDLRESSRLLGRREARYLVDYYYAVQDFRIQAQGQVRASGEDNEPNRVLGWVFESMRRLENNIKSALGQFASEYRVGQWMQNITGIGPVISAGFLAHLDVRECKTAGHFWRFAGLDPTQKWEKAQKRPWNAKLKVLTWKLGESFIKVQNNESDFYGKLFAKRKLYDVARNDDGQLADQAAAIMAAKKIGKDTDAYKWYAGCMTLENAKQFRLLDPAQRPAFLKQKAGEPGSGTPMLPPDHLNARARRYAVKMFLSHLHHVMWEDYHGSAPPVPYAFEKLPDQDHRHYIAPPDWPWDEGRSLRELLVDEAKEPE